MAAITRVEPRLQGAQAGSNSFQFLVQGEPGRSYQLQASHDLFNWTPLQHLYMTNSIVPWSDPDGTRYSLRYYRLRATLIP